VLAVYAREIIFGAFSFIVAEGFSQSIGYDRNQRDPSDIIRAGIR